MHRAEPPIGGEIPTPRDDAFHACLTDSGRSSLRLLLRSGFAQRRFLLPDYLCQIIVDVFEDEGADYGYYRVNADLTIDAGSLQGQRFDVLYVIDYFGQSSDYSRIAAPDAWVVQDSVFSPAVRPSSPHAKWVGFNSLRKISALTDGSLMKTAPAMRDELVVTSEAPFVAAKVRAKHKKWAFIRDGEYSEAEYLADFERGEALIDAQRDVHAISKRSLYQLLDFYADLESERAVRRRNYAVLNESLAAFSLPLDTDFPCLYVLSLARRDELRAHLRDHAIYLPAHWPNPRGLDNPLYRTVVSIPVDSRYDEQDMARVADCVAHFLARG